MDEIAQINIPTPTPLPPPVATPRPGWQPEVFEDLAEGLFVDAVGAWNAADEAGPLLDSIQIAITIIIVIVVVWSLIESVTSDL